VLESLHWVGPFFEYILGDPSTFIYFCVHLASKYFTRQMYAKVDKCTFAYILYTGMEYIKAKSTRKYTQNVLRGRVWQSNHVADWSVGPCRDPAALGYAMHSEAAAPWICIQVQA